MWRIAIIVVLSLLLLLAGPELRDRCRLALEDPNIALATAIGGLVLVYIEFCFPGLVIPASLGGALILVALAGFSTHSWNWAGVAAIAAGVVLLLVEARFQLYGIAGIAAIALLVWGVLEAVAGFRPGMVAALIIPWSVLTIFLLRFAWLARENKMVSFCFNS